MILEAGLLPACRPDAPGASRFLVPPLYAAASLCGSYICHGTRQSHLETSVNKRLPKCPYDKMFDPDTDHIEGTVYKCTECKTRFCYRCADEINLLGTRATCPNCHERYKSKQYGYLAPKSADE